MLVAALLGCGAVPLAAQTWPFPWPEDRIARYTARRASSPIVVDGRLDEAAWRAAERSPRFADLIGGNPGVHDTRAAVLWDDTYLYVGYWVEEPFVEATLTERDAPIYKDNDVELFIAGRDAYYEFEINAFGTIYEVLFIWEREFEGSGYARRPEFDRTRPGVRPFNGVGFTKHPRGPRIGYWNWDMPGLETAVHVDGTINDNKDRDRGWTVEMRIPWRSLEPLAMPDGRALPPRDGDEWRMDFSRFNQYKEAPPAKDPGGWAWSPHGVWDSHMPELFTHVRFSTAGAADLPARPQDKVPGAVSAASPMRTEAEARARAEANRRARQEQRLKTGAPEELISEYASANIGPVPASLGVSPFYQKYTDALGIPVIASDKVPDAALLVARDIVNSMLAARSDIRKELVARGWRTGVIAEVEMTMDIPEYAKMKRPGAPKDEPVTQADRDYHANRSRGLGGNPTTGAEENLLGYPGTRYWGEHIFVHEFSHAIMGGASGTSTRRCSPRSAPHMTLRWRRGSTSMWMGASTTPRRTPASIGRKASSGGSSRTTANALRGTSRSRRRRNSPPTIRRSTN